MQTGTARRIRLPRGQTTSDLVADALRNEICQGRFAAGEDLGEFDLASRFGVSRVPIREALRRLEAEGLVAILPNRGASVPELSLEEIQEIYELRMLIEGDLMRRAVPNLNKRILEEASNLHESLQKEEEPEEQDRLNRQFHSTLYGPAGRPRQLALVENLRNIVERYQNATQILMRFTPNFQRDHKRILAACRAGSPEQARLRVVEHLERARKVVLKYMSNTSADTRRNR